MKVPLKPDFLNVDLEIWSASKLDGLLAEMGRRVLVNYCGPAPKRHLLAVPAYRYYKNPDAAIHALCKVIESLSPAGRRIWRASRKTFDVGYSLRPDTLARVAALGANLAVTYYQQRLMKRIQKRPNIRGEKRRNVSVAGETQTQPRNSLYRPANC